MLMAKMLSFYLFFFLMLFSPNEIKTEAKRDYFLMPYPIFTHPLKGSTSGLLFVGSKKAKELVKR